MVIKPYKETLPLQIMRCLIPRYELPPDAKQSYFYLEKGHEGERKFAALLESLSNNFIILHDLLLVHDSTIFQIDALLITHKTIYLFEVKNYEGEYYIESDIWYTLSGKEIKNPLLQLNRCVSLLRQFLQKSGFKLPIKGKVIFINPEFTLYQALPQLTIVLPSQLNRFLSQFNGNFPTPGKSLKKLADIIVANHVNESSHRPSHYDYDQLKKGIVCKQCNSLSTSYIRRLIVCDDCNYEEDVDSSVKRSIKEFQLLFPQEKITTSIIHEWCGVTPLKLIRRVLVRYFTMKGQGKNIYYVDSNR